MSQSGNAQAAPVPAAEPATATERVNLILRASDLEWLDSESRRVNTEHDGGLSRSAILRGFVGGFKCVGANLGTCKTTAEIEAAVARALRTAARANVAGETRPR
jgi:hypothetical protein